MESFDMGRSVMKSINRDSLLRLPVVLHGIEKTVDSVSWGRVLLTLGAGPDIVANLLVETRDQSFRRTSSEVLAT
jgi:hypothetical protein